MRLLELALLLTHLTVLLHWLKHACESYLKDLEEVFWDVVCWVKLLLVATKAPTPIHRSISRPQAHVVAPLLGDGALLVPPIKATFLLCTASPSYFPFLVLLHLYILLLKLSYNQKHLRLMRPAPSSRYSCLVIIMDSRWGMAAYILAPFIIDV